MIYNSKIRNKLLRFGDMLTGSKIEKTMNEFKLHHTTDKYKNNPRLDNILNYAINNVPYYMDNVKECNITSFPVINKHIIKENIDLFVSNQFDKTKLNYSTTSGSTGTPFKFYYDDQKKVQKTKEVIYYNGWANYQLGDKHILNAVGKSKGRLKSFFQNVTATNPSQISLQWLETQRRIIKEKNILFYVGYGSVIKEFAEYCESKGDKPEDFKLKGIKSTAERLDENARLTAEKVFGCPVLCRYGCMETGVIAQECKEEHVYHINTLSYHVELLRIDSDEPAKPGEVGRVVITDLYNFGMPFIRYDTGDWAILSENECKCGLKGPVFLKVIGRSVENVTDPVGNLISWVAVNDKMWLYTNIKFFQFIQLTKDSYLLKLQASYNEEMKQKVMNDFLQLFGEKANINIEFVDEIKKTKTGKRPYIINEYLKGK